MVSHHTRATSPLFTAIVLYPRDFHESGAVVPFCEHISKEMATILQPPKPPPSLFKRRYDLYLDVQGVKRKLDYGATCVEYSNGTGQVIRAGLGKQLMWRELTLKFEGDNEGYVNNPNAQGMKKLYELQWVDDAERVFDERPHKSFISFSTMIYGFAKNGFYSEYLQLFSDMQRSCIHSDSVTFVAVYVEFTCLLASKTMEFNPGEVMKCGFESHEFEETVLLNAYARCGNVIGSYTVFAELQSSSLVSSHGMTLAIGLNVLFEESWLLLKQMLKIGIVLNSAALLKIDHSCLGYGSIELCKSVHAYIVGPNSQVSMRNEVIEMSLSLGNFEKGICFFSELNVKNVKYLEMIRFCWDAGGAAGARDVFTEFIGILKKFLGTILIVFKVVILFSYIYLVQAIVLSDLDFNFSDQTVYILGQICVWECEISLRMRQQGELEKEAIVLPEQGIPLTMVTDVIWQTDDSGYISQYLEFCCSFAEGRGQ